MKKQTQTHQLDDATAEMNDLGIIGSNIHAFVVGDHLYLEIDLKQSVGTTETGNTSLARSGMFAPVGGNMILNLNLTRKANKAQPAKQDNSQFAQMLATRGR